MVVPTAGFEPGGHREGRLDQRAAGHQVQHDQQPPDAPVAVVEGAQRLELVVGHAGRHDGVDLVAVIGAHPLDDVPHLVLELWPRRSRDEAGVRDPGARAGADHHLDVAHPTGLLGAGSRTPHESPLEVGQQADGEGASVGEPGRGVLCCSDVVQHLVEAALRRLVLVGGEHVLQRSEGAFERGRALRLPTERRPSEQPRVRQLRRGAVQGCQGGSCAGHGVEGAGAQRGGLDGQRVQDVRRVLPGAEARVGPGDPHERAGRAGTGRIEVRNATLQAVRLRSCAATASKCHSGDSARWSTPGPASHRSRACA